MKAFLEPSTKHGARGNEYVACLLRYSSRRWIAAAHPDRIASLVLGGTWARPDARFRRLFEFRARVLREMGPGAYEDLGRALTLPAGLP
jgi:hypothetical protein